MNKIKLAVIGAGAIAEHGHLPPAVESASVEVTALVDTNLSRAKELGKKFDIPHVFAEYQDVTKVADAAIVALPNHLHASVTNHLMNNGVHVLVEKPMALNALECDSMIKTATRTGSVLAVGMINRFYVGSQFLKQALDGGLLGTIQSFDFRHGSFTAGPLNPTLPSDEKWQVVVS